jgi:hypothetical protein
MIVIAETNFLIELALQQSEAQQVEAIVRLAEEQRIGLAIPAFAFVEAGVNLTIQSKRREDLHARLRAEVKQMARSHAFAALTASYANLAYTLDEFETMHHQELAEVSRRLHAVATVIPVTEEVIDRMAQLNLNVGDACICASVECYVRDLNGNASVFVTRDRDFEEASSVLEAYECRMIYGFGAAFGAVRGL